MDMPVLPVSELNRRVRQMLESSIPLMWVSGEICNFTSATSGHWYFSLKDANAQVRCVMFRHKRTHLDWMPKNGMQVEARVLVTLYEARGDFQLTVENLRQSGLGALYEKFERLKATLLSEGLFAEDRKKQLPSFPKTVGVITSAAGAVLHDVLTTLKRRNRLINIILYPVPVQGEGAAGQIAKAINLACFRNECDVLILCRGGGSFEDLWQFNEEIVARAIAKATIPIVSGVGHETDVTLADFVSDKRAPTPTGAAELVSPHFDELHRRLAHLQSRLQALSYRYLEIRMQAIDHLSKRLVHPKQKLRAQTDNLTQLHKQLNQSWKTTLQTHQWALKNLHFRLSSLKPDFSSLVSRHRLLQRELSLNIQKCFEKNENKLLNLKNRLNNIDPDKVLQRGYAIVLSEAGGVIKSAEEVSLNDEVTVRFSKNALKAKIVNKHVNKTTD